MDATTRSTKLGQLRRAFSLIESMFASALLAVSVAALASAFSASYAHQAASAGRIEALVAGEQLIEQSIALPVQAGENEVSIVTLNGYTDEVLLSGAVAIKTETIDSVLAAASTAVAVASPELREATEDSPPSLRDGIDVRKNLIVGRLIRVNDNDGSLAASIARQSANELAWVSVTVTSPDGSSVLVRRLVHAAEGRR